MLVGDLNTSYCEVEKVAKNRDAVYIGFLFLSLFIFSCVCVWVHVGDLMVCVAAADIKPYGLTNIIY